MSSSLKILISVFIIYQFASAQEARNLVYRANELLRSMASYSEITMRIEKPEWQREMTMKVWAIEPDYSMVLITDPARDKGTVTLKRAKEVWNYIPRIQRTIKIPPSMMLQSWMGSDFSNDDLVRQSSIVDDYTHQIIGEEIIEGYDCYKIEMTPRPEAGVVWGKLITWISKEGDLMLLTRYFDEDGKLVRTMTGKDVKVMGGRTIPAWWEIKPVDKPDQRTLLIYRDIEFNARLKPDFFSQQNMSRVK